MSAREKCGGVKLDADDVRIEKIDAPICDCGEPATHAVRLDLRGNGMSQRVYEAVMGVVDKADRGKDQG